MEKLKQMLSASLKVYKEGRDTRGARQEIVVDYLNTVPLAATPGYGEVNGLGNGLHAWFGLELSDVCRELQYPSSPMAQARAYKYVITLLAAIRGPAYYLGMHRDELESRVRYYAGLLEKEGIIDHELAENLKDVTITYATRRP
jgi:membrane peptidoglycan carboxypeptidase